MASSVSDQFASLSLEETHTLLEKNKYTRGAVPKIGPASWGKLHAAGVNNVFHLFAYFVENDRAAFVAKLKAVEIPEHYANECYSAFSSKLVPRGGGAAPGAAPAAAAAGAATVLDRFMAMDIVGLHLHLEAHGYGQGIPGIAEASWRKLKESEPGPQITNVFRLVALYLELNQETFLAVLHQKGIAMNLASDAYTAFSAKLPKL